MNKSSIIEFYIQLHYQYIGFKKREREKVVKGKNVKNALIKIMFQNFAYKHKNASRKFFRVEILQHYPSTWGKTYDDFGKA